VTAAVDRLMTDYEHEAARRVREEVAHRLRVFLRSNHTLPPACIQCIMRSCFMSRLRHTREQCGPPLDGKVPGTTSTCSIGSVSARI